MSKLFFKDKPVIGLEINQTSAKVMAIEPKKRVVLGYGSIELDSAKMLNAHDMLSHLTTQLSDLLTKRIIGRLPSKHAIISVPTSRTFTRSVTLPRSAESNLMEAIQLEAEQYIPVSLSELYIDYEMIGVGKEDIEVLISAVPKLQVDTLVEACKQVGLKALLIEPGINSVARLVREAEEGDLATVILDMGADSTDIAILDKAIRVTGGVNVGGHTMTQAIMEKMNVTKEAAHMLRTHNGLAMGPKQDVIKQALEPSLVKITEETKKVIRYYSERLGKETKLQQLIIVGSGSSMPGIGDYFTENMLIAARAASPWHVLRFEKLTPLSRQMKPRFTTAIGLSMVHPKEVWQ